MKKIKTIWFPAIGKIKDQITDAVHCWDEDLKKLSAAGIPTTKDFLSQFCDKSSFEDWVDKQAREYLSKNVLPVPTEERKRVLQMYRNQYSVYSDEVAKFGSIINNETFVIETDKNNAPIINQEKTIANATEQNTRYLDAEKIDCFVKCFKAIAESLKSLEDLESSIGSNHIAKNEIVCVRNDFYGSMYTPTLNGVLKILSSTGEESLIDQIAMIYGCYLIVN